MKLRKFYDPEHANRYLVGSVIRVAATPVYVQSLIVDGVDQSEWKIDVSPVKYVQRRRQISLTDKRLDMNPIPNGFVNFNVWGQTGYTNFVSRMPARTWKIGLSSENVRILSVEHDTTRHGFRTIVFTSGFHDMVTNKYLPLPECWKKIEEEGYTSFGLSRHFALQRGRHLFYSHIHQPVGHLNNNGELQLHAPYEYLTELLAKEIQR
jgi:hypothetical protein